MLYPFRLFRFLDAVSWFFARQGWTTHVAVVALCKIMLYFSDPPTKGGENMKLVLKFLKDGNLHSLLCVMKSILKIVKLLRDLFF